MANIEYRKPEGIKKVLVIGAGNMGEGIAQNFAQAGKSVTVFARRQETLEKCLAQIDSNLKLFEEFELLKEDTKAIKSRIATSQITELPNFIKDCDFVVETIPELLTEKKALLAILDSCPAATIIGSNTSSFTITTLTEGMKTPQRVVGIHYFNPAHIMPLVEIHRGKLTADIVVEITRDLMQQAGKSPIIVRKEVPGFIVNRIQAAIFREISYLLDEGVTTPADLDIAANASYGLRLSCIGPMEADDMIGLDTSSRVSANIFKTLSNRTEPSSMLLEKVQRGELGIKTGKGWYDYSGKTKIQIMDERNRRLLKQLVLFYSRHKQR